MRLQVLLLLVIFCMHMLAVPSLGHRSMLYRVDEHTDRYWNGYEWVYILYPLQINVAEAASIIINGCNNPATDECNDGDVRSVGGPGAVNRTATDMRVGDNNSNREYRSFVKFPISSLYGKTLASAVLKLTILRSLLNGSTDNTSPFNNPRLGNTLVIHINDYGTLDDSDFNAPSIGNDPGVLIAAGANPSANVSISILAAMQDDINSNRSFTTYMIRTANSTDGDNRNDRWHFYTRNSGTTNAPRIEYTLAYARDIREALKFSEHDVLRSIASSRNIRENAKLDEPDLLDRSIASARGMILTLNALDLQVRSIAQSRPLLDSSSIADTISRLMDSSRQLVDANSTIDTLARAVVGSRTFSDTLSALDGAVKHVSLTRIISDSLSTLDSLLRHVSSSLAVDDAINAIDVFTSVNSITRSISSSIVLSDSISRMLDSSRHILDGSAITDSIGMGFILHLIDISHVSEAIGSNISYLMLINDSINIAGISNAYGEFVRALQDAVDASSINYLLNLTVRAIVDGITITDEASRLTDLSRVLDEPIVVMDELSRAIDNMSRMLDESISSVGLLSSVTSFHRDIGTLVSIETVNVMDDLSRSIDVVNSIENEVLSVFDDLPSLSIEFERLLGESISVNYTLGRMIELTLQLAESYSVSDLLNDYTGYIVGVVESIGTLVSMLVSVQSGTTGTVAGGTGTTAGGGGAGVVFSRSTFITVDASIAGDTLLVEGFLMDRDGVVPFSTSLSITIVNTQDTARSYRSSMEVVDGRYRFAMPIDELFGAIAPNSAEMTIKAIVVFDGDEHDLQGIRYLYLGSSAESSEVRIERSIVFEAPAFNLVPSSIRYSGERLLIINVENDGDNDIDSLRIVINEGKVLKVKVSKKWKVTVQGDGILLEGVDAHTLDQGKRLMILVLKQGQLNYIVTAP